MQIPHPPRSRLISGTVCVFLFLLLCGAGSMVGLRSLGRSLNHDEHQFLAPASLFLHEGLLPYRDFPLFHLPNLVFAYAVAERVSGDLILGAKLLNLAATIGLLGILGWLAFGIPGPLWLKLLLVTASVLLLIFDPLFLFTAGKTWNHELPGFLLACALVFHLATTATLPRAGPLLSGLFAGLAVGCRLTFLAPAGALVIHLLLVNSTWPERARSLALWSAGFVVALIPTLYCCSLAPDAFFFDNLKFPRLRLLDASDTRAQKTTLWGHKLRYLAKEVLPASCLLFSALLAVYCGPWRKMRLGREGSLGLLLLGCGLVGCFLPSRYQYQHFYALIILVSFAIVLRLRESAVDSSRWGIATGALLLLLPAVLGAVPRPPGATDRHEMGYQAYLKPLANLRPEEWFHARFRRQQLPMRGALPQRPPLPATAHVLTLGPTAPLSVGLRIYPAFSTGVFAWRSARLVSPENRKRFHFVGPDDLEASFGQAPPEAILTGVEDPEKEAALVAFAERHGYGSLLLPRGEILWYPPTGR